MAALIFSIRFVFLIPAAKLLKNPLLCIRARAIIGRLMRLNTVTEKTYGNDRIHTGKD
jgi:hypothetical protein